MGIKNHTIKKFSLRRLGLYALEIFIVVSACGPVLFSFLYGRTHLYFLPYAPLIKDIIFYIFIFFCFCGFLIRSLDINRDRFKLVVMSVIFVLLIIGNWLVTRSAVFTAAIVLRRFILPILSVLVFSSVCIDVKKLHIFLMRISCVVLIFGLYDYFFIDFDFWNNVIKLPEYWRGGSHLPWMANKFKVENTGFMSFDTVTFMGGKPIRRMVSGFTDPTNFASFLISIHILFSEFKSNRILKLLIALCAVLTISKAAIIDIFVILPLIKLFRKIFQNIPYSALFLLWFAGFYFVAFLFVSNGFSLGPFSHINGFYTGANAVFAGKIFGNGIGRGGNFSDETAPVDAGGSESGLGGMLAQTGLGAIVFILFFYMIIKILEKDEQSNRSAILMIFAWTFIFVFSESSFGTSGNILFWVYPGIALYNMTHKSEQGTQGKILMSSLSNQ
jgi:hypothetical protein